MERKEEGAQRVDNQDMSEAAQFWYDSYYASTYGYLASIVEGCISNASEVGDWLNKWSLLPGASAQELDARDEPDSDYMGSR